MSSRGSPLRFIGQRAGRHPIGSGGLETRAGGHRDSNGAPRPSRRGSSSFRWRRERRIPALPRILSGSRCVTFRARHPSVRSIGRRVVHCWRTGVSGDIFRETMASAGSASSASGRLLNFPPATAPNKTRIQMSGADRSRFFFCFFSNCALANGSAPDKASPYRVTRPCKKQTNARVSL